MRELIEKHLAQVFEAHGLRFSGEEIGSVDGKTGQIRKRLEFRSPRVRLRIERSDGEINAQLWCSSWERWRYVRELSEPSLHAASIDDLLARVPARPLSDEEMLAELAPHVVAALQCAGDPEFGVEG